MAGGMAEDDDLVENHEINVTPFIDVMLVLLIIFMVAAPLATVDVNVDLPVSNAGAVQRPERPVYVSVQPDLTLAVGDEPVAPDRLAAALQAATGGDRDRRIFLRADRTVSYGDLMGVMNMLRAGGYLKIALVGLETTAGAPAAPAAPEARDAPAPAVAGAPTAPPPAAAGAAPSAPGTVP